jgi:hypothetical protein
MRFRRRHVDHADRHETGMARFSGFKKSVVVKNLAPFKARALHSHDEKQEQDNSGNAFRSDDLLKRDTFAIFSGASPSNQA